jgi:hypothetical protein
MSPVEISTSTKIPVTEKQRYFGHVCNFLCSDALQDSMNYQSKHLWSLEGHTLVSTS